MQKLKQQQLLDRMLEKLPDHVTFLLVILSGFLLARLTWTLFPADPAAIHAANQTEIAPAVEVIPATASATDIGQELANYHLLGVYQPPQAPTPVPTSKPTPARQAPRVPLRLVGVYALPNKSGVAVIEVNGANQKVVGVGETIGESNGITLEKVFYDKVEISWQGKIETLSMPKLAESTRSGVQAAPVEEYIPEPEPEMVPDQLMLQQQEIEQQKLQQEEIEEEGKAQQAPLVPGAAPPQVPQPQIDPEANAGSASDLSSFRQQVAQNNLKLLEVVRPSPVSEKGQLTGFRVVPGQNEALFRQTGLQAGDIVTGINGTPLNSNSSSLQAMQGLMSSASADLTILRAGQTTSVRVSF
ncbi:type II secretion system protein N [uncultured Thiothrix sp.]|mgnify:CR=1 FL=1|uniref:type II secretion system protein N n=1 Tax=uncultured Thiothrix sp. TaxID=223185 RepID=UPI00261A1DC3|nr:type II secretion system protein N [uncultured Thiothrix sp.]HMT92381.1 type II secretion system protein N [Thiolinea sp.]